MSEEALLNLKLFHLIAFMIVFFLFMKASLYGVQHPNNKKHWKEVVLPIASTNLALLLLYTFWMR